MWATKRVVDPTVEPLTVTEAKNHLRVDSSDQNTLITDLITVARDESENHTRRAFVSQTWELQIDAFPGSRQIRLPRPPLRSVTSIKYTTTDDVENTMSTDDYIVDTHSEPGRVVLKDSADWPSDTLQTGGAVKVRFVAGYSTSSTGVPASIRHAIRLIIGRWYAHTEDVIVGQTARRLPDNAKSLLPNPFTYRGPSSS